MDIVDLSVKLDLNVPAENLKSLAEDVYELVDRAQANLLGFENPEIHVWVEQGSLNYKAKIIIGLNLFYAAVSGYGGFIDGVEKIQEHSTKVINYINEKLIAPNPSRVMDSKRSAGLPEQIKSIIRSVHQGKLSPEEATEKVTKLLEAEEGDSHVKESIVKSFWQSAKDQYREPYMQLKAFPDDEFTVEPRTVPKRKPVPKLPPVEASLHGIELWYDRRTGAKEIRRYTK